jgi:RNA polymerase sigma factor (sigma-70 family)
MPCSEWAQAVEQAVRRCQAMGASRADAEEYVQEAVVCLLARQAAEPGAEPVTAVAAWLAVAAHRKFLDRVRRCERERQAVTRLGGRDCSEPDPAERVTEQALAVWLVQALEQLPVMTRRVCEQIAAGADVEQTARQLGLTCRAVQSHLTRARRLLRHLAAGTGAVLACATVRLLRPVAAVAAPLAVATAGVTVTLLPHHTPLPPPVAVHAQHTTMTPQGVTGPPADAAPVSTTPTGTGHIPRTDPTAVAIQHTAGRDTATASIASLAAAGPETPLPGAADTPAPASPSATGNPRRQASGLLPTPTNTPAPRTVASRIAAPPIAVPAANKNHSTIRTNCCPAAAPTRPAAPEEGQASDRPPSTGADRTGR